MDKRMAAKTSGVCEKLRSSLSSLCCESAIVTLTLVSALAITGEILVEYGILTTPSSQSPAEGSDTGQLSSDKNTSAAQTAQDNNTTDDRTMDIVQKVFHYVSLVIAAIFFIEIVLKLLAFRMRFLVSPWQVLDMMVVLTAALAEAAFEIEGRMIELEACTYVVVFRLWRLPFACNIKAKAMQHDLEQEIEVWKAGKIKMEDKCRSLEGKQNKQKEKIERLERELATLKKEMNENRHVSRQQSNKKQAPAVPQNGAVPYNKMNGLSSNHLPSPYHVNPDDKTRDLPYVTVDSETDNETIDGTPRKIGRPQEDEAERETEEDTVDEEEDERAKGRNYFRSGSESSLSCQALEHEVHVQIEGQDEEGVKDAMTSQEAGNSPVHTPVQKRHKDAGGTVYYDNEGYNPDIESDPDGHGVLMHEFEGTKTYKSAEGIPMTDL